MAEQMVDQRLLRFRIQQTPGGGIEIAEPFGRRRFRVFQSYGRVVPCLLECFVSPVALRKPAAEMHGHLRMVVGDLRPPVPDMLCTVTESGVITKDGLAPVPFAVFQRSAKQFQSIVDPFVAPEGCHGAILERESFQIVKAHQATGMARFPPV